MKMIKISVADLKEMFTIAGKNCFSATDAIEVIRNNAQNKDELVAESNDILEIIVQITDLDKYLSSDIDLFDIFSISDDIRPNINLDVIIEKLSDDKLKFIDLPGLFFLALNIDNSQLIFPILMADVAWKGKDFIYVIPVLSVVDFDNKIYKISFPNTFNGEYTYWSVLV